MTTPASATMIRALILRHALKRDDEVFGILANLELGLLKEMNEGLGYLEEMVAAEISRRDRGIPNA